jgi:hypothetical protein
MEYLIGRTDGDWFDLPYATYPDVLHPTSFPWHRVEGWGDHRIRVLGCDIAVFYESPGMHVIFEGDTVPREQARQIVEEMARNVASATGQTASVIEID